MIIELIILAVLTIAGIQGAVWWAGSFITGLIFVICFVIGCVVAFMTGLQWLASEDRDRLFLPTLGCLFCGIICAGVALV